VKTERAYHFLPRLDFTSFGDEPPWKIGESRFWSEKCKLCESGYHSSPTWYGALRWALGPMACVVDIARPVEESIPMQLQVSRRHTLVDRKDASSALWEFSFYWTKRLLYEAKALYPWYDAIGLKRQWLKGEVSDKDLRKFTTEQYSAWSRCLFSDKLGAAKSLFNLLEANRDSLVPLAINLSLLATQFATRHEIAERLDYYMSEIFSRGKSGTSKLQQRITSW